MILPIQSRLQISWNADEGKSARGWKSPCLGPGSFLHGNAEIGQKMERFQAILAICSANFSCQQISAIGQTQQMSRNQQNSPNFEEGSSSIHPFHRFNSADYDRLCNAKASGREHVIRHGHRFSVQLPTVRAILGECWSRVGPGDVKRNSCHLHPPSSIHIHPYSSLSILIHLCLSSSIFILCPYENIYSQIT